MVRTIAICCGLLASALLAPPLPSAVPRSIVIGTAAAIVYPLPYRTTTAQTSWDLEVTVLNLINTERVAAGLRPLMPHATIRSAARAHGAEMFAFGYLSHFSLTRRSPLQRVLERGVRTRIVGENIAYASDIRMAHLSLMASDEHRQNILSGDYDLVGIGVLDGGPYGVIVVQDFSRRPLSP